MSRSQFIPAKPHFYDLPRRAWSAGGSHLQPRLAELEPVAERIGRVEALCPGDGVVVLDGDPCGGQTAGEHC